MIDPLRLTDTRIGPAGAGGPASQRPESLDRSRLHETPFAEALRQAEQTQATGLKFSAHAQTRMQSRQINLGPQEMQRLEGAAQRVAEKGGREALVLLDQTALVLSVPNRTVITVVDQQQLKQNVFTNIDSAVIA